MVNSQKKAFRADPESVWKQRRMVELSYCINEHIKVENYNSIVITWIAELEQLLKEKQMKPIDKIQEHSTLSDATTQAVPG